MKRVVSALHLDVSPGNIILGDDGETWLLDCSHAARGRRVFDVTTAIHYHDPRSVAGMGDPMRYGPDDPSLESSFLGAYTATCDPPWRAEEGEALVLERALMLVHGVTYWVDQLPEETRCEELTRFRHEGFPNTNTRRSFRRRAGLASPG